MLATLRAAGFASVRSFVEPVEEAGVDIGNIVFIASVEGEEVRREEEREEEREREREGDATRERQRERDNERTGERETCNTGEATREGQ